MVDSNFTHIAVVLDRSGSMACVQNDMEGGFNTYVEQQREVDGRCTMSLYQFDDEYEVVFEDREINDVPTLQLVPRGCTALFDAVGRTINSVGEKLAALEEEQRPGRVILVIITDGQENASHEFTRNSIKEMIEHQESVYSWEIVFLGSNFDAYAEGMTMGFAGTKSFTYASNHEGIVRAFDSLSANTSAYRCGTKSGMDFEDDQREQQKQAGAQDSSD